jgi:hypothetical protein
MESSDQLQAPAALFPEYNPVRIEQEAEWASQLVFTYGEKKNLLPLAGFETLSLQQQVIRR